MHSYFSVSSFCKLTKTPEYQEPNVKKEYNCAARSCCFPPISYLEDHSGCDFEYGLQITC